MLRRSGGSNWANTLTRRGCEFRWTLLNKKRIPIRSRLILANQTTEDPSEHYGTTNDALSPEVRANHAGLTVHFRGGTSVRLLTLKPPSLRFLAKSSAAHSLRSAESMTTRSQWLFPLLASFACACSSTNADPNPS